MEYEIKVFKQDSQLDIPWLHSFVEGTSIESVTERVERALELLNVSYALVVVEEMDESGTAG